MEDSSCRIAHPRRAAAMWSIMRKMALILIAGDDARAENHRVAAFRRDMLMVVHGTRESADIGSPACRRSVW